MGSLGAHFGRVSALVSFAATCWFAAAPPLAAQEPIDVKISISVINDPNHESIKLLKQEIDTRSKGRLNARLFPAAQLGTDARVLEAVQLGTVEILSTPPAFAGALSPAFQATDAPGLFSDLQHASRALSHPKFRTAFAKLGEEKGVTVISVWPHSLSNYVSPTPIRKIDDFKGKKIRVLASRTESAHMANLGATGMPITFAEVLPALQQRIVDGVRSSLVVMNALRYYDVAKYATMVDDGFIPIAGFVSNQFLNKLPAELRTAVIESGLAVDAQMAPISEGFSARAEAAWTAAGGEIIRFSPDDHKELIRRAREVAEQSLGTNPQTREIFALLKEAAEATRR